MLSGHTLAIGALLAAGLVLISQTGHCQGSDAEPKQETPVYLASFFPRPSPFARTQTKNRLTQKKIARKLDALNTKRYRTFRVKINPVLVLIQTLDLHGEPHKTTLAFWQLGEGIATEKSMHQDNGSYHDYLITTLADDSGMDPETLKTFERFHRQYALAALLSPGLTWGHYRLLVFIEDHERRAFYEKQALKEAWTPDQLETAIRKNRYEQHDKPEKPESPD